MAYPTGSLAIILSEIDSLAMRIKQVAITTKAKMASVDVSSLEILRVHRDMYDASERLTVAAATPGIAQYAKDQKNDQGLDVVAEFNAMKAAMDNVVTEIESTFPKAGGGYLLARSFVANVVTERMFTPAQTAGIQTNLQVVIDAIGA